MRTYIMPRMAAGHWTSYHTYLTVFLSESVFFSVLVFVFSGFILNNIAISFAWNSANILLIFSIIGIGSLFTIFPNYLTDKYGRKPISLIINVFFYAAIIGSAFAPTTSIFIIFQFIAGVFGIDLYAVIISEEIPPHNKGKVFGIVSATGMSAALLAAYLFIFTGQSIDMWRYLYAGISFIGLVSFALLWFKMRETRQYVVYKMSQMDILTQFYQNDENSKIANATPKKPSIFRGFQKKYLNVLLLSTLIIFLTDTLYLTIKRFFVIFLLTERPTLGFNAMNIGTWSIFVYIGSIIGYYISGISADKFGKKKTLYISVLIYFVGSVLFLFSWNISIIFMGLFFVNLAYAIYRLIAEIFAVAFFPTKLRASGTGLVFLLASILGFIGNFVMFILLELLGTWGMMFFIVGTSCLIALVFVTFLIPETANHPLQESYITVKLIEEIPVAEMESTLPSKETSRTEIENTPPILEPYLPLIDTSQSIEAAYVTAVENIQSIEEKLAAGTT